MTCREIEPELTAYHFGVVSDVAREDVEAHLLSCRGCLQAYLDIKRAVETGEGGPVPSTEARHRLRRAVAAELDRPWSWWERPLALAFAGSAVFAAMIALHVVTTGPAGLPSGNDPGATIQAPR
jgi:hypothetical protein